MRRIKLAGLCTLMMAASASTWAQVIMRYDLGKEYITTQTSSAAPVAASGTPYDFYARVEGSSLSGLTAPSFTKTNSSSTTAVKTLGFDPTNQKWKFNSSGNISPSDLSTSFFTSSTAYPFTVNGATVSFTFPATDDFVTTHPQITSGTWVNGNLSFDSTQNFAFDFSSFTPSVTAIDSIIGLKISGPGLAPNGMEYDDYNSITGNVSSLTSFMINANTLQPNSTYSGDLSFFNVEAENTTAIPGATGFAVYRDKLTFSITTVPEPADFAELAGGSALALTALARRRKKLAQ
jgi:hypothetical protein